VTYAELDRKAEAIAARLRSLVRTECVAAVLLPRNGEDLYAAQLGVLRAGAAYACIEPAFPDEQVREILRDSDSIAVLTDDEGAARARRCSFDPARIFNVTRLAAHASDRPAPPPPDWLTPSHLAYLIYTSGTTGRPKGVMIEHRSIVNLVQSDVEDFGITPAGRVAQNSASAYDSSIEEIWMAFAVGATLVVMDDDAVRLGPDIPAWLHREGITVFCPPPTLLRSTRCHDPATAVPNIAMIYVGGEAITRDLADRWAGGRRLENGYGPTECTITATHGTIREGGPITIGRPVRGLRAWVLNGALDEVPEGEQGELCLSGIGLARGYLKQPDLTAQKFPVHPRVGRIYRTGDLVHRDSSGGLCFDGRIDSQVKLRGYRIELEAIEARLAECEGVREAACCVQGEGQHRTIAAFVVPECGATPSFDALKGHLRSVLPAYMVPSRFAAIAALPTATSGKLDRSALPAIEAPVPDGARIPVGPHNDLEARVEAAIRQALQLAIAPSIGDDFFNDLGGDSLSAAVTISLLRADPATAAVTVRDLYETRTIAALADRLARRGAADVAVTPEPSDRRPRPGSHPAVATAVQTAWLMLGLVAGSAFSYVAAVVWAPRLVRGLGLIALLLIGPLLVYAATLLWAPIAVLLTVLAKRMLIGRYRPLRAPAWGSFYVRHWMVQQTARLVPWTLLEGTVFELYALRALGARIGQRVHIHRGVNLRLGGWDLLDIGDDVTVGQDAALRLVDLVDGELVVGPVDLGAGSAIEARAGVGAGTVLEPDAHLTALSFLADGERIPRGERWDGVPAHYVGPSPPAPECDSKERALSPPAHGAAMLLAQAALWMLLALPVDLPAVGFALFHGLDAEDAMNWLSGPSFSLAAIGVAVLLIVLSGPAALAVDALAMRALGRTRPGVISRWSLAYIRVWLKTQILRSAGDQLSGTLFWPVWLRLAGMKIGPGCEISTIIDVVPELLDIGPETFFADGIYLGGPVVHRGTVALARTRLGRNTFAGNHAVIRAGHQLPADILIGVSTVSDDAEVRPGTSWFGHPPFELPRREVVEMDRRLTHDPSLVRFANRCCWELLRFALPVVPILALPVWYWTLDRAAATRSLAAQLFMIAPLVNLALVACFCLLTLATKWMLLGRVKPGIHPLWSCWCSRWDFLYVVWNDYARTAISALEGTLLLAWYLRAMGMEIGRRVLLGPGFAQVVDPDMLHLEDDSTVSCQFQAHTFEDRVLKIDHIRIRRQATVGGNAVLLYGADIGARTRVMPQSVVMKREALLPGRVYAGCPTRPRSAAPPRAGVAIGTAAEAAVGHTAMTASPAARMGGKEPR
jgi:non-ribosomal peptide synthetase-like protein